MVQGTSSISSKNRIKRKRLNEKRCNISDSSCISRIFFLNLQRYKTINQNVMNEKFPYGYDLNAYIDKAFD